MKKTLFISFAFAAILSASLTADAAKPSKKAAAAAALAEPVVDYYQQYQNGEDINIAGLIVNKRTYPVCALEKAYELGHANCLQSEDLGVVFLDYDAADGKEDVYEIQYNIKPENKVIIGRYSNHQPTLKFASTCTFYPTQSIFALKNVRVESANYSINTAYETCPLKLYVEDCTLITSSPYSFNQANVVVENNFESICVVNSIVRSTRSILIQTVKNIPVGTTLTSLKRIEFKNTVFTAPETTSGFPPIALRTNGSTGIYPTPDLDVVIENCTFHNYSANGYGVLALASAKSINFNDNVIGAELLKNTFLIHVGQSPLDPQVSGSVQGNYAYSSNDFVWTVEFSARTLTNSGLTVGGNTCVKLDSPFGSKMKEDKLYIPVDESRVGGAGATYTTKLWNTWTK